MNLFKTAKSRFHKKLGEEYLYGIVANEIANGQLSPGLYAKALSETDGDEQKAKAEYIKLRVDMLKAESMAIVEMTQKESDEIASVKKIKESARPVIAKTVTPKPKPEDIYNPSRFVRRFSNASLMLGVLIILSGNIFGIDFAIPIGAGVVLFWFMWWLKKD